MSSNDFTSVITDMIAQDMMTHFKDLMKRVLFSFTSELSKTHKISVEEVISIWNKALPHLAYEVHMPVQETKVSPSSDDEEDIGCQFVLTRGKNKGETCGKKNVKGSHFCTTHKKSDEPKKNEKENKEETEKVEKENKEEKSCECKYILTRGKNKGEKCGKKTVKDANYCATHNKKEDSDSEREKEEKVEKVEDKVEEVIEEKVEKVEDKVEEVIEEKVEKKQEKVKNKKQDDTAEKAKQLEQKLNEQKQKDENELKLKKIEEEKKNIGVNMAKSILQNLEKKNEPVSISVMETQNSENEEQDDEDEDSFTYEQCKKQILINPKLNEEGELEFSMTKKNLEKFINKKVSSSEEQYKVTVNIFNKGMNIFYVEDGKKEQKKLLKFRFNKYHSVINDYLSSL